ncbi:hypothetical protein LO762_04510 [Actinocorallia sp. API 0066]|uniref:hypothetical protein n=1 Tax=Actinocorallia sp. API 0066 TaxID=2896846 RepID=UPI001E46D20E|nr:hypothetical protein [Actinocorallia sp. API 0066]MCD0448460.1 hypothetical protein [Actinocorallia sp. API 0066]
MSYAGGVTPGHVAELLFLVRRYPRWTIWFGPATGSWWALPPRDRDIGDFVEATDVERLVARIEVIQSEPPAYRDAASFLRLGAPPVRRVPLATRPGDPAR